MEKPPDGIQKEKLRRSWRRPRFINQVGPRPRGPHTMEPNSLLDPGDSYGKPAKPAKRLSGRVWDFSPLLRQTLLSFGNQS